MICYLIRHGKDDESVRGGWSSTPLTEQGIADVHRLSVDLASNKAMNIARIYASDLLRHGEHSISQIATLCGYDEIYSFSRQFKNEFGLSPTEFIKKYKSSK